MIHVAIFHPEYPSRVEGVRMFENGAELPAGAVAVSNWPQIGPQPFVGAEMRVANGALYWRDERTLAQAKAQRIVVMQAARNAAMYGGFTWSGSPFDSDEKSIAMLTTLKVAASQVGFTSRKWRLANDNWRTLNALDAAAVWAAMDAHIQAQYARFDARETTIRNATIVAAVDAVTWE